MRKVDKDDTVMCGGPGLQLSTYFHMLSPTLVKCHLSCVADINVKGQRSITEFNFQLTVTI